MSIVFTCSKCGKQFEVPDALAGKSGRCRVCGASSTIPNPRAQTAPPRRVSSPVAAASPPSLDAFGFNDAPAVPRAASFRDDQLSERAPAPARGDDDATVKTKKKKKKRSSRDSENKAPLVMMVFLLGAVGLCAVGGIAALATGRTAYFVAAAGVSGMVLSIVGSLWIWVLAFKEEILCGILFFVPFYALYYAFTRFDDTKHPFALVVASFGMSFLAGMFAGSGGVPQ